MVVLLEMPGLGLRAVPASEISAFFAQRAKLRVRAGTKEPSSASSANICWFADLQVCPLTARAWSVRDTDGSEGCSLLRFSYSDTSLLNFGEVCEIGMFQVGSLWRSVSFPEPDQ